MKKIQSFGLRSLAVFAFLVLGACSQNPAIGTGGNLRATYQAPTVYADHRAQQQTFNYEAHDLAFTDHGDGPTLVLLHGVPTSSWMYRKLIPMLQDDVRVISVDLLGYGSSDKPKKDADYSAETQAARVRALLAYLDVQEYGLLMHDMGGLVAWEIMRQAPQDVTHAVVLNTIVGDEGFRQPNLRPGMMTRQLMNAYSSNLTSAAVLTKTFNDLGLKGEHELTEDECFGYVLPMREGADSALYAFFTSINDQMLDQLDSKWVDLNAWEGEAVIMWGARDETLTTGQIPALKAGLSVPDANVFVYPDNAHFLAEEIPEEIADKVVTLMATK